jgi:hypothetical protein
VLRVLPGERVETRLQYPPAIVAVGGTSLPITNEIGVLIHDEATQVDAAHVRHVFVIVLENKTFSDTFGTSTQDPYLQKTLVPMGGLLTEYYGTGHVSLDNYISMISGQSPTKDTDDDCLPGFTASIGNDNDVEQTGVAPQGQIAASGGCIYSRQVRTSQPAYPDEVASIAPQ